MPAAVESMVYAGATPWHGLGVSVPSNLNARDAIAAAGLAWDVESVPVYDFRDGQFKEHPEHRIIRRTTDGAVYGVASPRFKPVQNVEAFQFFDAVVGAGEAIYHTAGSLDGGRIVWILAQLPESIDVTPGDRVDSYVLLSASHQPGSAVRMLLTPVRVVCQNTLNAALQGQMNGFRHAQVSAIMPKANEARGVLGLASAHLRLLQQQADRLVNERFSAQEMRAFSLELQGITPATPRAELRTAQARISDSLVHLFHEGRGQAAVAGTKWAAFNAVTEYVDHAASYRVAADRKASARLAQAWFGDGARMKQNALDILTASR